MANNEFVSGNFIEDDEKMFDFKLLTKDEFLSSYSYLTEEEYNNTVDLCYNNERIKTNDVSQEAIDEAVERGWSVEDAVKGYAIFEDHGSDITIDGSLIVMRIDDICKFDDDFDACRQAEKDGILFINDIDGLEKGCYVDTPENRKICAKALIKFPYYRIANILATYGGSYWSKYKSHFYN